MWTWHGPIIDEWRLDERVWNVDDVRRSQNRDNFVYFRQTGTVNVRSVLTSPVSSYLWKASIKCTEDKREMKWDEPRGSSDCSKFYTNRFQCVPSFSSRSTSLATLWYNKCIYIFVYMNYSNVKYLRVWMWSTKITTVCPKLNEFNTNTNIYKKKRITALNTLS